MDMVRCMQKLKNLSNEFWAEAISCVVYVLNRCPTRSVVGRTLEECWSNRRPSVRHLEVFGCIAYSHVPDTLRRKLDDKGEKCFFIGYSEDSKTYRLYNLTTVKVIISRDITFDDYGVWHWTPKSKETAEVVLPSTVSVESSKARSPFPAIGGSSHPQHEH